MGFEERGDHLTEIIVLSDYTFDR